MILDVILKYHCQRLQWTLQVLNLSRIWHSRMIHRLLRQCVDNIRSSISNLGHRNRPCWQVLNLTRLTGFPKLDRRIGNFNNLWYSLSNSASNSKQTRNNNSTKIHRYTSTRHRYLCNLPYFTLKLSNTLIKFHRKIWEYLNKVRPCSHSNPKLWT